MTRARWHTVLAQHVQHIQRATAGESRTGGSSLAPVLAPGCPAQAQRPRSLPPAALGRADWCGESGWGGVASSGH